MALAQVRSHHSRPDHVLVEASGASDLTAVAEHARLHGLRVEATVVVADADAIRAQAVHPHRGRRLRRQLLAADLIVLNKAELLGQRERTSICDWLAGFIPRPRVVEASFGRVPVSLIVDRAPEVNRRRPRGRSAAHRARTATSISGAGRGRRRSTRAPFAGGQLRFRKECCAGPASCTSPSEPDQRQRFQLVGSRWSVARTGSWAGESRHSALALIGHAGTFDPRLLDVGIAGCCVVASGIAPGEPAPYVELAATS